MRRRLLAPPPPRPSRLGAVVAGAVLAASLSGCAGTSAPESGKPSAATTPATACTPSRQAPGPLVDLTIQPSRRDSFLTRSQVQTLLRRAKRAGATVIGVPVSWRFIQSNATHAPKFGDLQPAIGEIHRARLALRLSITGVPDWAFDRGAGDDFEPPRSIAEFRRWQAFLRQLLSYAGPVAYLEVWPNPNVGSTWKPGANAAEFAQLLKATGEVVRREFPKTRIIAGGIRGNDAEYLRRLYGALGPRHPFDYVGLKLANNETAIAPDDTSPDHQLTGFAGLTEMARVAKESGRGEPLYVTEFGYQVTPAATLSDEQRAAYLVKAFDFATCAHVAALSWYSFHPTPWDSPPWALVRLDGRTTATYRALVKWSDERAAVLGKGKESAAAAPTP